MNERSQFIVETLNPPKGKGLWYGGPTHVGSLRGIDAKQAVWKLDKKRHSIWELALHIAYWEYSVRHKLNSEDSSKFPRSPSNWPAVNPKGSESDWKKDKELIKSEHVKLIDAVSNFPPSKLDKRVPKSKKWSYADLLMGAVTHNVYHTGQIILMKRLYKEL